MKGLSQSKVNVENLEEVNINKNIKMEEKTKFTITDDNGEAMLNMKIMKGIPGKYNLQFQAQNIKSSKSSTFLVLNTIKSVEFVYSVDQSFLVNLEEGTKKRVLTIQPRLKITYNKPQMKIKLKNIDVTLFDKVEITKYLPQEILKSKFYSTESLMALHTSKSLIPEGKYTQLLE